MKMRFQSHARWILGWLSLLGLVGVASSHPALAKDYFLVVGGGYSPESNQASLEANFIFFQDILVQLNKGDEPQFYFFSDGDDPSEDLQVTAPKPNAEHELFKLMRGIHRQETDEVIYRNHQVPRVEGANTPANVKQCLKRIASEATAGDRVIIYITAHGGSGPRKTPRNTTVMGWKRSSFSVSDLAGWLQSIPTEVPCISIMAQCYCGGFADSIFADGDEKKSLTERLQIGFFAQQHNLPAAGCRPDIENDEEFSSYFWGAMIGRSRTGEPFHDADENQDGKVSFAEAYAFTVIKSRTIDIPLRASERLLRVYSTLDVASKRAVTDANEKASAAIDESSVERSPDEIGSEKLSALEPSKGFKLEGAVSDLLEDTNPTTRRIAVELMKQLDVPESAEVADVFRLQEDRDAVSRNTGGRGRDRFRSGRRQLLTLIGSRWEKLADREQWKVFAAELPQEECDSIFQEIQILDGFSDYNKLREETQNRVKLSQAKEMDQVAFKRLIHQLELAVLEKNLPLVASPEIQDRYRAMIALENESL
ncbi:hypothetical protein SH449x_004325 [Pirellulaceae bacterium SH449]